MIHRDRSESRHPTSQARRPRGSSPGSAQAQPRHGTVTPAPAPGVPGRLIAFEGLEGSGISTQMRLVHRWLSSKGCRVFSSNWESSDLVEEASRRGRKQQLFTPMTYSLLHATDFSDRYDRQILPMLKAGFIVLCDRYIYTSFASDCVRGCDPEWVEQIYSFALPPHITFLLELPIHVALERKFESRQPIDYFAAGMDLGLSLDIQESYRIFQGRVNDQYLHMVGKYRFIAVDATLGIHAQQKVLREEIAGRISLGDFVERKRP